MDVCLLALPIATETDVVLVRRRAYRLTELAGFEAQDQNRIATAASELARCVLDYAGSGRVEFRIAGAPEQHLVIVMRGHGSAAAFGAALNGSRTDPAALGIVGARRLVDDFALNAEAGGFAIRAARRLPKGVLPFNAAALRRIAGALAADGPADPMEEFRRQNQQIMLQLEELRSRQEELERLNQELQDTNRGVVALYAELDERADHLRRADELKSKFLSNMSHEFRTPLNSIMALSRLLLSGGDGPLTGEQRKQVGFIVKAAEDLATLVNDLLDIAKVEAGKTVVTPSAFTADELFGALRGMLRPLLAGDAVALVFEDTDGIPALQTDEGKVSQILRNFVSNAIKFTERGEVRVWATADPQADTVSFHVRDTGLGIAAENLELIFQEFAQVDNRLQRRMKGTGLGLPLARKLAELLRGHITVASVPGEGSTFTATIPRVYPAPDGEAAEPDEDWRAEPGRSPVLLIEDNAADVLAVQRFLAGTPYQVLHAATLRQAERALCALRPDAILLEVQLAAEECWRLILRLRQDETRAQIPLVVISAGGEERKARHLGADEYLEKPVARDPLVTLLDRLTGRRTLTRVLLIDDEAVMHYLVRHLLPRSRYTLETAADASEGLQRLNTGRPDIILLDINMPVMDGYDFLARLRATPAMAELPVVVLSSAVPSHSERVRLRSAAAILSKAELSAAMLTHAIDSALRSADMAEA